MLIISRKKEQKIIVADNIEITILEIGRNRVRFGIKAPKDIPIHTRLKTVTSHADVVADDTAETSEIPDLPVAVGMSKIH